MLYSGIGSIVGLIIYGFYFFQKDKAEEKKLEIERQDAEIEKQWELERPERERREREEKEEAEAKRKRKEQARNERVKKIAETEQKGMSIVMNYESSNYGNPKDVSSQNLGYDIISERDEHDRYIEVKAKSEEGEIMITQNEWDTATRLRNNYFLYLILNCSNYTPDLYIIKNPTEELSPEYDSLNKKYKITTYQVKQYGEKVNI
ncbi:MAG: DUF3883 domain-containing protein [Candidatus Cloacimonetes bacterium]|nr:DUF3883 domain-containing protein [Candidatus Cloacimonadota bacterium]